MCYEVKCSTCGKSSWGGCGWHVTSVYNRIPNGQHCQCKAWPGVQTHNSAVAAAAAPGNGAGSGTCTIL